MACAALAVASVGNVLYAIGGSALSGTTMLASVYAYDPAANTWTTKCQLQVPRTQLMAASLDGVLYAYGGWPGGLSPRQASVEAAVIESAPPPAGGIPFPIVDGSQIANAPEVGGPLTYRIVVTTFGANTIQSLTVNTVSAWITGPWTSQPAAFGAPTVCRPRAARSSCGARPGSTCSSGTRSRSRSRGRRATPVQPRDRQPGGSARVQRHRGRQEPEHLHVAGMELHTHAVPLGGDAGPAQRQRRRHRRVRGISSRTRPSHGMVRHDHDPAGLVSNRVKAPPQPGSLWVSGGYGTVLACRSKDLAGPWYSWSNTGQTEPLYLRWMLGRVGMHQSGYVRYEAQVLHPPASRNDLRLPSFRGTDRTRLCGRVQHALGSSRCSRSSNPIQGPVAKIIAVIIIIMTGLTLAFGETSGGFRRLIQIVFGLSIAFAASSFFLSFFSFGGGALV